MDLHVLIRLYLLACVFASFGEAFYIVRIKRRPLEWRDFGASYLIMIVRLGMERLAPYTLSLPLILFAASHSIFKIPLHIGTAVLLLLIEEFHYYWLHRLEHENRWLWATHFGHHTSREMNLSAAFRVSWTDQFAGNFIFLLPMVFIGFPPEAVILCFTLSNAYQIWLHTDIIPKLGWLEHIFNTPSHHRVHHAKNPEYVNANFGGIFVIYDRIFHTFVRERDDLPCRYGLIEPFESSNPFVIAFRGWTQLFGDLARAASWRERTKLVFGRSDSSRRGRNGRSASGETDAPGDGVIVPTVGEPLQSVGYARNASPDNSERASAA